MAMGHKRWCIPDLYLKEAYLPAAPSHESVAIANNGETEAIITATLLFEGGREPLIIKNIRSTPMSSMRLRIDQLEEYGVKVPTDVPYSLIIESTQPVVVGYGRLNWIEGRMQSFGCVGYFEDKIPSLYHGALYFHM